jgi:hypothetical protein
MEPTADDLLKVADLCTVTLAPAVEADWGARAQPTEWTCRQTLKHLCSLAFAPQLATRASDFQPLALQVVPNAPVAQLVQTMHAMTVILAEVARAAPRTARAFHPAGMADPSGWIAMGIDELLIHRRWSWPRTSDRGRGRPSRPRPAVSMVAPEAEPRQALLWANGRSDLPRHPSPGGSWLWHCAPLTEWDGTVPRWDAVAKQPVRR